MGFRPNWTGSPTYVEYIKDYAQPDGRMARVTALFTKAGFMQVMDQAQLANFVVTVQGTIDPVIDEVKTKAPAALRPDMLHALAVLEGLTEPDVDLTANCDHCGALLNEWTVDNDGRIHCMNPQNCYDTEPEDPNRRREDP